METYQDMTNDMHKHMVGTLRNVEWFILFTFIEQAIQQDNMFASIEDVRGLQDIAKRLHDQIFPTPKDPSVEFAETIMPKLNIVKKDFFL